MDRNYDVITFFSKYLFFTKTWGRHFCWHHQNCNHFIKTIFKNSRKVKRIRNYVSKCNLQGTIQKKSASGSRTLPCLIIFFQNFILVWKCPKWALNRGTLVSATAIYQTKCPFAVPSAFFFCSFERCLMILDYSLIYICISWYTKIFWFPVKKCWC